jgi:hypothetical protein
MVVGAVRKDDLRGQLIERRSEDQAGDLDPRMAAEVTARSAVVDRPAVILARDLVIGPGAILPARMATDECCLDRERDLQNLPGNDCMVDAVVEVARRVTPEILTRDLRRERDRAL